MRTKIIFYSLFISNELYSQSAYLQEVYEDSRSGGDNAILWLAGIITFVFLGLFIVLIVPLMIRDKIEDFFSSSSDTKNVESRNKIQDSKLNSWFSKGYQDGKHDGCTCMKLHERISRRELFFDSKYKEQQIKAYSEGYKKGNNEIRKYLYEKLNS